MRKPRADGQETRQRLLEAAGKVFAEKGFWEATHAAICREAQVNTAAVNYHFRSKEELYVEAWKYAFEKTIRTYPPDGGMGTALPLHERLHGRILAFMRRIADPETYDLDILHKEIACPTGLLKEAIQAMNDPIRQGLESLIKEMIGTMATEQQIRFTHMNIAALCFGPLLHMRHMKKSGDASFTKNEMDDIDIEVFAEHTTRFILSGIYGICREIDDRQFRSESSKNLPSFPRDGL